MIASSSVWGSLTALPAALTRVIYSRFYLLFLGTGGKLGEWKIQT